MNRNPLLQHLDRYERFWPSGKIPYQDFVRGEEQNRVRNFRAFVQSTPNCFLRTNLEGHLTASSLIVDPSFERVLLTHHRKLNKWLQLGGHADGMDNLATVALKEAEEESGLKELRLLDFGTKLDEDYRGIMFDLDIHKIPTRKKEPEHFHYDARYLILAPFPGAIQISHESIDLRWFTLTEAIQVNPERSLTRLYAKLKSIKAFL